MKYIPRSNSLLFSYRQEVSCKQALNIHDSRIASHDAVGSMLNWGSQKKLDSF